MECEIFWSLLPGKVQITSDIYGSSNTRDLHFGLNCALYILSFCYVFTFMCKYIIQSILNHLFIHATYLPFKMSTYSYNISCQTVLRVFTLTRNPTTCRSNGTYKNSLAQFPRPLKTPSTTTSINNTWLIKNRKSLLLSHNIDLILIYALSCTKKISTTWPVQKI